jgi:glycosyltransferase domain-containing protein
MENRKLNRDIVPVFKNSSFNYIDKYALSINPAEKMLDALHSVETEYCVICFEDDFVIPTSIHKCVDFLNVNRGYTSAYGNNAWLLLKDGSGRKPEFFYRYYENQSNAYDNVGERLINRATNNNHFTLYSVHRTEFMKYFIGEAVKVTNKLNDVESFKQTPDLLFAELLLVWLPPVYGKEGCIDTFHHVREDCTPQGTRRAYITQVDLVNEAGYKGSLINFRTRLVENLRKQAGIGIADAFQIADEAIMVYNKKVPQFVIVVNSIISKLHLPNWIDTNIRKMYRLGISLIFPVHGISKTLPDKYQVELDKVHLHVLLNARDIFEIEAK